MENLAKNSTHKGNSVKRAVRALVLGTGMAAVTSFNVACSMDTVGSKEVSPDTIHQDLYMKYSEESNSTLMSAQFRVGGFSGTTVSLDEPSGIKINDQVPARNTLFGTRYEARFEGYVPFAKFEYKSTNGKVLANTIGIDTISLQTQDPAFSPGLNVNQYYEVPVNVPNFTQSESVEATITQPTPASNDPNVRLETPIANGSFDPGRGKIVFSPAELRKLANGTAKLQISRRKTRSLAQATREGGNISAAYELRPFQVSVTGK